MSNTVSIDDVLDAEILPTLPAVAVKVLSLEPNAGAEDMAQIISKDASLSARILKVVNSPLYAPAFPVGSIKRAIAILGNRQARTLSLAFSLVSLQNSRLDFSRFWEHSLTTAVGTRQLFETINPKQSGDGFTAGLLANLGAILLAGAKPVKYQEVLQLWQSKRQTIQTVEKAVFGFDHTALGATAAQRWGFPKSFLDVITHHHDPLSFSGEEPESQFVEVIHLSSLLADIFYTDQPELLKDKVEEKLQQIPELKDLLFDDFASEVEKETRASSTWMGIHLTMNRSIADILEEANKRLVAISGEYEEAIEWIYRTQVDKIQLAKGYPPDR